MGMPSVTRDVLLEPAATAVTVVGDKALNVEASEEIEAFTTLTAETTPDFDLEIQAGDKDADNGVDTDWFTIATLNITAAGTFGVSAKRGDAPLGARMRVRAVRNSGDATLGLVAFRRTS